KYPTDIYSLSLHDALPIFSIETIVYVACLVVLAALIAGAAPALRATRGLMNEGLRALSNRISVRLGATWTALVVMQVALAVAILDRKSTRLNSSHVIISYA